MAWRKKDVTPFLDILTFAPYHTIEWEILHLPIIFFLNKTQYIWRYAHFNKQRDVTPKSFPQVPKMLVQERRNSMWNGVTPLLQWHFEVGLQF